MDNEETKPISYTAEYIVGAGYVLFFCLAITLCSLFYYFTYLQPSYAQSKHSVINPLATSLPPTPHISADEMQNSAVIFEDDFSRDKNHWTHYSDQIKEEVRKGKLYLESRVDDNWNFTECYSCPILKKPFYLQADLVTDKATDEIFGIVFGLNRTDDNFYSFLINTESKRYYFYHLNYFGWSLRASGESDQIRSFPAAAELRDLRFVFLPESSQVGASYDAPNYPYADDKPTYVWNCGS